MLAHSTKDIAKELTKLKKEKFDDELGFMHDIKNEARLFGLYLSPLHLIEGVRLHFLRLVTSGQHKIYGCGGV